jgi:ubiquinone/menaquinone biosynthesis C-methylase UbiE
MADGGWIVLLDLQQIIACPLCRRNITRLGDNLICSCGYGFKLRDGFFSVRKKSEIKIDSSEFYTKQYYQSPEYDHSNYRLNGIISIANPKKNDLVLDIGCGSGEIAIQCAKLGADVFGIDVSRDALKLSAEKSQLENVKLNLLELDSSDLPFRDSLFDLIILADVIEHIDDKILNHLLKECFRLLKSEGRLIIHSEPTKNIIILSKFLKELTFGRIDLYSRHVSPNYEFLHVRYHWKWSLNSILRKNGFYPMIWGECTSIDNGMSAKLMNIPGIRDLLSNQLWGLAFKKPYQDKSIHKKPLDYIDVPFDLDIGICSDIFFNYGFYCMENNGFNKYRWIEKKASLFINVPRDYRRLYLELFASNPDINKNKINVKIFVNSVLIANKYIYNNKLHEFTIDIPEWIDPGINEFQIEVDRTFVPKKFGINKDTRRLGIAICRFSILR